MVATRAAILDAARPILLRDGLGGTTLDRVAAEGGVAKMTLYRHFPSKEALFEGLVAALCGEMRAAVEGAPAPVGDRTPPSALADELHAFTAALTELDALAFYRLVVADGWRFPGLARLFEQSGMEAVRRRVGAILLGGGVPAGQVGQRAAEVVALALGDAFQRAVLGIARGDESQAFARQIEGAVRHAFR